MNINKEHWTLQDLLKKIREKAKKAQEQLYLFAKKKCYPSIKKYIINNGGTEEDAEDIFHDAMIILFAAILVEKFKFKFLNLRTYEDQLCSYLMAIAKNLWLKKLRKRKRQFRSKLPVEELLISEFLSDLVADKFQELEGDCKLILIYFFIEKLSPRVMAKKLGTETEQVKKRLTKCIDIILKDINQAFEQSDREKLYVLINNGIKGLKERCQKILTGFYYSKKKMSELAKELGYANAHVVIEQKNRCMKHLKRELTARLLSQKSNIR